MWKKRLSSLPAGLIAATMLLNQTAIAAESDSCKLVRMADPGWTDITVTNAMAGILLNARGYEQTVSNLSVPITYVGLKKEQIDVFLSNWMPAQKPLIEPRCAS